MGVEPAASSTSPAALATCVPGDDRMHAGQGWHLLPGEGGEGLGSPILPQLRDDSDMGMGMDMGMGLGGGVGGGCSAGAGDDDDTNQAYLDAPQPAMGDKVRTRVCAPCHP